MTRPDGRPAAAMLRGVVCRSCSVVGPTWKTRLGPSVRKTTFAGTCSERPSSSLVTKDGGRLDVMRAMLYRPLSAGSIGHSPEVADRQIMRLQYFTAITTRSLSATLGIVADRAGGAILPPASCPGGRQQPLTD